VIIFSVAVGPDQTGRVTAQISSLNGVGGHRRLNVAITRARRELAVFATLRPEQIDLGRTGARGVIDFKHFLEFASRGTRAIAEAFPPTGRDVESPFEEAVKRALEARLTGLPARRSHTAAAYRKRVECARWRALESTLGVLMAADTSNPFLRAERVRRRPTGRSRPGI
jgi:hypothetical protein